MLAWYYGSWKNNQGNIGSGDNIVQVPNETDYGNTLITQPNLKTEDPPHQFWTQYPHIINPRIERSDFVEFEPVGEAKGIYNRYVLYVPEKFVDDPNSDGKVKENPKVCHIEFRRGDMDADTPKDPYLNVDDNYCYRIYFTKGGYNNESNLIPKFEADKPGTKDKQTWENMYEQNVDNLKKHWPIVRNHVYSFVVEDAKNKVVVVKLEVLPWKEVPLNDYKW